MKPAVWRLGRFAIICSVALGLTTAVNRLHYAAYRQALQQQRLSLDRSTSDGSSNLSSDGSDQGSDLSYWATYGDWLFATAPTSTPNTSLYRPFLYRNYSLTLLGFGVGGSGTWLFIEFILQQRRSHQRQLRQVQQQLKPAQQQLRQAQHLTQSLNKQLRQQQQVAAHQNQSRQTLEATIQERDGAIAQIQALQQQLHHTESQAQTEAEASAQEIARLHHDFQTATMNLIQAQHRITSLQQELSDAEAMRQMAFQENQKLMTQRRQLEQEQVTLTNQIAILQAASGVASHPQPSVQEGDMVMLRITEANLYTDEIQDLLLDILKKSLDFVHQNSRRHHILLDILEANAPQGGRDEIERLLRTTLRDYRSLDPRTRRSLEQLGFEISEDGKHYKLIFRGDARYTITMPKTGGDRRGGQNLISEIRNRLL